MEHKHRHKAHDISLLARTMDDGKWSCSYSVTYFGKSQSAGFSGFETGDTREDSEKRALKKAQERIDSIVG